MATDKQLPPLLPDKQESKDRTTKAKELLGSLASRSKAAGLLIAKQAERTKLLKVTLPGRYRAFGKHLYGKGQFCDEFPSGVQAINALLGQIKTVEARSANDLKAEGIAAKAKAVAKAALGMVQVKTLKMKLRPAFAELGKTAFDKHGEESGLDELIRPIAHAKSRLEVLAAEIGHLSHAEPGQILTPTRIAVGGVAVVAVLLLFALSGLVRGQTQKTDKQEEAVAKADKAKDQANVGVKADKTKDQADAVAKADTLRDTGQKADAINRREEKRPRSAGETANKAQSNVKTTAAQAGGDSGNATGASRASMKNDAPPQDRSSPSMEKSYVVSKGYLKGNITVEIAPELGDEISLKNLEWNQDRVTADMTWEQPGGPDQEPWHCSVYDANGDLLDKSHVEYPPNLKLGQTFKTRLYVQYSQAGAAAKIVVHR